jgi:hypothetical protein
MLDGVGGINSVCVGRLLGDGGCVLSGKEPVKCGLVYSVVGNIGVLCGIVHGTGNVILMRGGACAVELRLMGLGVGSRCAMVCVFVL